MKKIAAMLAAVVVLAFALSSVAYAGADIDPEALRSMIDQYVEAGKDTAAAFSIGVIQGDEVIYETQQGWIDLEEGLEADDNTVYEWASVSKMLVWVSVMQLWERGEIDLEADIRNYLPDGFLTKLEYDEKITMYHLMNHTAGFQEILHTPETVRSEDILSLEEALVKYMPAQIYEPGKVCSYSNWGAALAASIVENVSGEPFYEYVRKHIFMPLGMDKTAIKPDWSDNEWVREQRSRIKSYAIYTDAFEAYGNTASYIQIYPAGSVTGTFSDFIKFARGLASNGKDGARLFIYDSTARKLFSPSLYYSGTSIARNCHGLWTLPYGDGVVGHSGNSSGFSSSLFIDPESRTAVAVMTNEAGETYFNYGLLSLVFGEYRAAFPAIDDARDVSGIYTSA